MLRPLLALALTLTLAASAQSPLKLAITFDDLPAHAPLPPGQSRMGVARSIIRTLHRENLPPTFGFVNAIKVQQMPDEIRVLQLWQSSGERLGSHTFSHPSLEKMTAEQYEADIAANEPLLEKVAGTTDWHWFRYPFLVEGETPEKHKAVRTWLADHHYRVAEVSLDFEDYLWNEPYARCATRHNTRAIRTLERTYLHTADEYITIFQDLNQTVYGHQIPQVLLLHIGAFDAHMLPRLIALFRQRGYTFAPLEEVESDPAYQDDPSLHGEGGGSLQELVADERSIKLSETEKPYKLLDHLCR